MPEYQPIPKNPNTAKQWAILGAHYKLELAAKMDRGLALVNAEGSRRFLIHSDDGDGALPARHIMFGLQPELRNPTVKNMRRIIVRVPMVPLTAAPESLVQAQASRAALGNVYSGRRTVPSFDIFCEVIGREGECRQFLVADEGLKAYNDGGDIIDAPTTAEKGHYFDIVDSYDTAAAQAELTVEGPTLDELAQVLLDYEPFSLGNYRTPDPDAA